MDTEKDWGIKKILNVIVVVAVFGLSLWGAYYLSSRGDARSTGETQPPLSEDINELNPFATPQNQNVFEAPDNPLDSIKTNPFD